MEQGTGSLSWVFQCACRLLVCQLDMLPASVCVRLYGGLSLPCNLHPNLHLSSCLQVTWMSQKAIYSAQCFWMRYVPASHRTGMESSGCQGPGNGADTSPLERGRYCPGFGQDHRGPGLLPGLHPQPTKATQSQRHWLAMARQSSGLPTAACCAQVMPSMHVMSQGSRVQWLNGSCDACMQL